MALRGRPVSRTLQNKIDRRCLQAWIIDQDCRSATASRGVLYFCLSVEPAGRIRSSREVGQLHTSCPPSSVRYASRCFMILHRVSRCFIMFLFSSRCFGMFPDHSLCFSMFRYPSQCFGMLHGCLMFVFCSDILRASEWEWGEGHWHGS
jgi:hypothetical protein